MRFLTLLLRGMAVPPLHLLVVEVQTTPFQRLPISCDPVFSRSDCPTFCAWRKTITGPNFHRGYISSCVIGLIRLTFQVKIFRSLSIIEWLKLISLGSIACIPTRREYRILSKHLSTNKRSTFEKCQHQESQGAVHLFQATGSPCYPAKNPTHSSSIRQRIPATRPPAFPTLPLYQNYKRNIVLPSILLPSS